MSFDEQPPVPGMVKKSVTITKTVRKHVDDESSVTTTTTTVWETQGSAPQGGFIIGQPLSSGGFGTHPLSGNHPFGFRLPTGGGFVPSNRDGEIDPTGGFLVHLKDSSYPPEEEE